MKSAPVNVGAMVAGLMGNAQVGRGESNPSGFGDVLNIASGKESDSAGKMRDVEGAEKSEPNKEQSAGKNHTEGTGKAETAEKRVKTDRRDDGEKETADVTKKAQTSGNGQEKEEIPEELAEVVASILSELREKILAMFEIGAEKLDASLEALELELADLLDPENLKALVLEIHGETDQTALLTDENLYQTLSDFTEEAENLQAELRQMLGVPGEELVSEVKSQLNEAAEALNRKDDETLGSVRKDTSAELPFVETTKEQEALPVRNAQLGDESKQSSDKDQKGNDEQPFAAVRTQEMPQEQIAQTQVQSAGTYSQGPEDIMNQILEYMRVSVKPDMDSISMQLHPESLGTLQIHLSAKEGVMTAQFVTASETVRAALEQQMMVLLQNFENQNIKVEAIEVTVSTHSFENNLQQGREGQEETKEGASGKRTRTRRLNLSDLNTEELTEDERIEALMMEAAGNTLDYRA